MFQQNLHLFIRQEELKGEDLHMDVDVRIDESHFRFCQLAMFFSWHWQKKEALNYTNLNPYVNYQIVNAFCRKNVKSDIMPLELFLNLKNISLE
jgi:hypothetical protein